MIPALLFAHDLMASWMSVWMAPFEATFDMIESELDRQRATVPKHRANASGVPQDVDECSMPEEPGVISRMLRHLPWSR